MTSLLTVAQVAAMYGVSLETVRRWCRKGKLVCRRFDGRTWGIPEDALEGFEPPRQRRIKRSGAKTEQAGQA